MSRVTARELMNAHRQLEVTFGTVSLTGAMLQLQQAMGRPSLGHKRSKDSTAPWWKRWLG